MQSRSRILLEKELRNLSKNKPWGIDVQLVNDNLYEWLACIGGPKDTVWESGIFQVYLKFDEHFDLQPPCVCFHTIPYHPNIDMITGKPCIDFLEPIYWQGDYRISMILLLIQNMLENPVVDNAVNPEAALLYTNSRQAYNKIAQECVKASQQISDNILVTSNKCALSTGLDSPAKKTHQKSPTPVGVRKTTKLSFDDYLAQWNGIATTKCSPETINTYHETLKTDLHQKLIHDGTEMDLEQERLFKQEEYETLYFGVIHQAQKHSASELSKKQAKLNQMKRIYLPKKAPAPTPRSPGLIVQDPDVKEVDELVAWTETLDTLNID